MPLFALYKNRYKVRESRIAVSLRRNAEEQEMQRIRVRVRTAFLRHQEARQQVEALKLSVRQAQENYRIMQNRYLNCSTPTACGSTSSCSSRRPARASSIPIINSRRPAAGSDNTQGT